MGFPSLLLSPPNIAPISNSKSKRLQTANEGFSAVGALT